MKIYGEVGLAPCVKKIIAIAAKNVIAITARITINILGNRTFAGIIMAPIRSDP